MVDIDLFIKPTSTTFCSLFVKTPTTSLMNSSTCSKPIALSLYTTRRSMMNLFALESAENACNVLPLNGTKLCVPTHMAQYSPEELGFIDEVSKDERTVGRRYGRSRRGTRARKSQPFVRGRRTSTVGILSVDGFVTGTSVEGLLMKASFLHWMEFTVVSSFVLPLTHS